jgi:predicted transcriptional regulator
MTGDSDLRVNEAMTADPVTIEGMASVNDALTVMRGRNISCLVVNRRDPMMNTASSSFWMLRERFRPGTGQCHGCRFMR